MNQYDIIIVGGGLAGLTAAIHLSQEKLKILLLEKEPYPHHKVCGEYVSNEIKPYLEQLGISLRGHVAIDTLQVSTLKGTLLETPLPLGGMGISRYAFDNQMFKRACSSGAEIIFEQVSSIDLKDDIFNVVTIDKNNYTAPLVLGAYGKRSPLDKKLSRNFIKRKSPWLAVKAHYNYADLPENVVALHNFTGGYAGLSRTETGAVNFCYLASYKTFEQERNIDEFNNTIVAKNSFLKSFLNNAEPLFEKPLSIAQISFDKKQVVQDHILMCGDTAGLIHPLCGNGMAMAIHSAKIASELIIKYFSNKKLGRFWLESMYSNTWHRTFAKRMSTGRRLQALLMKPTLSDIVISSVAKSPYLVKKLIEKTHGKPITVA